MEVLTARRDPHHPDLLHGCQSRAISRPREKRAATCTTMSPVCVLCSKPCQPDVTLPCHVVCRPCMEMLVTFRDRADVIQCLHCFRFHPMTSEWREIFRSDKIYRRNDEKFDGVLRRCHRCKLKKIQDLPHAEYFCYQCQQPLCRHCHKFLHPTSSHQSRHHIVTPLVPSDWSLLEQEHMAFCHAHNGESMSVFCVTCQISCCATCIEKDHAGHKTWEFGVNLKNARNTFVCRRQTLMQQKELLVRIMDSFYEMDHSLQPPCSHSQTDEDPATTVHKETSLKDDPTQKDNTETHFPATQLSAWSHNHPKPPAMKSVKKNGPTQNDSQDDEDSSYTVRHRLNFDHEHYGHSNVPSSNSGLLPTSSLQPQDTSTAQISSTKCSAAMSDYLRQCFDSSGAVYSRSNVPKTKTFDCLRRATDTPLQDELLDDELDEELCTSTSRSNPSFGVVNSKSDSPHIEEKTDKPHVQKPDNENTHIEPLEDSSQTYMAPSSSQTNRTPSQTYMAPSCSQTNMAPSAELQDSSQTNMAPSAELQDGSQTNMAPSSSQTYMAPSSSQTYMAPSAELQDSSQTHFMAPPADCSFELSQRRQSTNTEASCLEDSSMRHACLSEHNHNGWTNTETGTSISSVSTVELNSRLMFSDSGSSDSDKSNTQHPVQPDPGCPDGLTSDLTSSDDDIANTARSYIQDEMIPDSLTSDLTSDDDIANTARSYIQDEMIPDSLTSDLTSSDDDIANTARSYIQDEMIPDSLTSDLTSDEDTVNTSRSYTQDEMMLNSLTSETAMPTPVSSNTNSVKSLLTLSLEALIVVYPGFVPFTTSIDNALSEIRSYQSITPVKQPEKLTSDVVTSSDVTQNNGKSDITKPETASSNILSSEPVSAHIPTSDASGNDVMAGVTSSNISRSEYGSASLSSPNMATSEMSTSNVNPPHIESSGMQCSTEETKHLASGFTRQEASPQGSISLDFVSSCFDSVSSRLNNEPRHTAQINGSSRQSRRSNNLTNISNVTDHSRGASVTDSVNGRPQQPLFVNREMTLLNTSNLKSILKKSSHCFSDESIVQKTVERRSLVRNTNMKNTVHEHKSEDQKFESDFSDNFISTHPRKSVKRNSCVDNVEKDGVSVNETRTRYIQKTKLNFDNENFYYEHFDGENNNNKRFVNKYDGKETVVNNNVDDQNADKHSKVRDVINETFGESFSGQAWNVYTAYTVAETRLADLTYELYSLQDLSCPSSLSSWMIARPIMSEHTFTTLMDMFPPPPDFHIASTDASRRFSASKHQDLLITDLQRDDTCNYGLRFDEHEEWVNSCEGGGYHDDDPEDDHVDICDLGFMHRNRVSDCRKRRRSSPCRYYGDGSYSQRIEGNSDAKHGDFDDFDDLPQNTRDNY